MIEDKKSILSSISASLYVSFQVLANILSVKIALLPGINWAIDGGTIIYPLTFTLRDFVHKTMGKKNARYIVLLAGAVNLLMVLLFLLVDKLPNDPTWALDGAYKSILLPVWRITIASITSQIISELVDTEIFSWIYKKYSDVSAVLISNTVALVVDSVLFSLLAFYGSMPLRVVFQIIVTNIIVKLVMSILTSPTIKLIPRLAKPEEV